MNRSNKKHVDHVAVEASENALSRLLAEMIGLGVMFAGQSPYALMQGMQAANVGNSPADPACDDLFDNVPV